MAVSPNTIYIPKFPYLGNQVIISSGRVLLHAKDDSIFLFGKKAIGLSSPGTLNVDAEQGVKINAPKIELGLNASVEGQPLIKGASLVFEIDKLLTSLEELAKALQSLRSTDSSALVTINSKAELLRGAIEVAKRQLPTTLSTVTYTK